MIIREGGYIDNKYSTCVLYLSVPVSVSVPVYLSSVYCTTYHLDTLSVVEIASLVFDSRKKRTKTKTTAYWNFLSVSQVIVFNDDWHYVNMLD